MSVRVKYIVSTPKTVYLGGGLNLNGWRETAKERLEAKAICIDPFADSRQGAIAQFVEDDLHFVGESDIVLAYHDYHAFDGLAAECGYAYAKGIPIVYVCLQPRVSSFIAGMAKAVFTELDPALEYIEKRLL